MSNPQTEIHVCSGVRLDSRQQHSIWFATVYDQLNYFGGKVVKTFPAYSYCRKTWSIKVEDTLENARKWNYLYFTNSPSGKVWFYFINNVEYVNDNTVELFLELDVIQTFLFHWELQECFIERQHTEQDYVGLNEVDEGLSVGELTCIDVKQVTELNELCVLMVSTVDPLTNETVFSKTLNNIFAGAGVFATESADYAQLGQKLNEMSENGKIDSVVTMWMYPKNLVSLMDGTAWGNGKICKPVKSLSPINGRVSLNFSYPYSYKPKNKKLYQYPFMFIQASNNNGAGAIFRFERFRSVSKIPETNLPLPYQLIGAYSPEGVVKLVFNNYDNQDYENALPLMGFPTCAWNADSYKIWLAQNQAQRDVAYGASALTIATGAGVALATLAAIPTGGMSLGALAGVGGGLATAGNGLQQVMSLNAQTKDMSIQPPQARGNFSGSVNIVAEKQSFTFYVRQVTSEHAKIIDDFFTMYGYAQKRLGVPNIHARPKFTFIKTVGCMVGGQIGNGDRLAIQRIFDQGITFWTNGDKVGDYTQDNSVTNEGEVEPWHANE